jgi:hypothetical protein
MIGSDRSVFFPDIPFAQVIEAEIGDDPVNPGIERTLETETPQVFIGLEEGILMNVLGVRFRSGKVESQAQNRLIVVTDEDLEGRAVSLLRLTDQSRVVNAVALCCHGAPQAGVLGTAALLTPGPA